MFQMFYLNYMTTFVTIKRQFGTERFKINVKITIIEINKLKYLIIKHVQKNKLNNVILSLRGTDDLINAILKKYAKLFILYSYVRLYL